MIEYISRLGRLRMLVLTVTANQCFFVRVFSAPNKCHAYVMRNGIDDISLFRRDLCVCGRSKGQKVILLSEGTEFLAISGLMLSALVVTFEARLLQFPL